MLAYILVTSQLIMWIKISAGIRQAEGKIIQIVKPLVLSFSYKENLTSDPAKP